VFCEDTGLHRRGRGPGFSPRAVRPTRLSPRAGRPGSSEAAPGSGGAVLCVSTARAAGPAWVLSIQLARSFPRQAGMEQDPKRGPLLSLKTQVFSRKAAGGAAGPWPGWPVVMHGRPRRGGRLPPVLRRPCGRTYVSLPGRFRAPTGTRVVLDVSGRGGQGGPARSSCFRKRTRTRRGLQTGSLAGCDVEFLRVGAGVLRRCR